MNLVVVRTLCLISIGLFLVVGCHPSKVDSSRSYDVKGVVKAVMAERNQVEIQHETIPGYMDAMTMTFGVRGSNQLDQLRPGDVVQFKMMVTATDGWIEQIVKVGETNEPVRPLFRVAKDVEPLQVGDAMPEYHFTNELGRVVSLSDFKGQAVAFTFIFTRCPFPTYCPRLAGNFAAVMQKLKALNSTNWHLLTITFDPEFDTPAVLQAYANRYNYDPKCWSFLTGDLVDITAIAEQFGLMFWRPEPSVPAGISHNMRTVVLDPNGRVHKILPENEWKVDEVVDLIVEAGRVPTEPKEPATSR